MSATVRDPPVQPRTDHYEQVQVATVKLATIAHADALQTRSEFYAAKHFCV